MYGITATFAGARSGASSKTESRTEVKVMEIVVLLFFVLLAVAAAAGLTVDSRDSADWKPTMDGRRAPRWP
jgi:hypothetical protein